MTIRTLLALAVLAPSVAWAAPSRTVATVAPASKPVAEPADEPSSVEEASDANLESTEHRQGMTFTAAVGAGLTIGFGYDDSAGRGGSLAFRVGRVATRRTVITFELDAVASLHRRGTADPIKQNLSLNLLAGAQYYANRSLWLRAAGGLGVFHGEDVKKPDGMVGALDLVGASGLVGIGVDLARFKWAALGLEIGVAGSVFRDGVMVTSATRLGLAFD